MNGNFSRYGSTFCPPTILVGTYDENGKSKFKRALWGGIYSLNPPCYAVSLREHDDLFHEILDNNAYSVSIPSNSLVTGFDLQDCSGHNNQEYEFHVANCKSIKAPYIKQCPYIINCKLTETHRDNGYLQIIGEVVDVLVNYEYKDLNTTSIQINELVKFVAVTRVGQLKK